MLFLSRAKMLIPEASDPLPGPAGRPQIYAGADEDGGQHHRGPRQLTFGPAAELGPLLLGLHSLIRHGLQISASLMAHSTTFRQACAAPALGHIAPLQVNVATTRLVSPRSPWGELGFGLRRNSRCRQHRVWTCGKKIFRRV